MLPAPSAIALETDITVWIIEDNEDYGLTVQDIINSRPHLRCTHVFATCEDALEELNATMAPQIVVMDIGLPGGMDGIAGVARIKALAPSTQIIMLTISDDNDKIFNAIYAGASGYLLKTSSRNLILESIDTVRQGGAVMNPKIARRVMDRITRFPSPGQHYDLTARELDVLRLLMNGMTNREIADTLSLSRHTVDTHVRHIYEKLHVHSRAEVIAKAYRERIA